MEEFTKSEQVVLLFDSYSEDSKKLHTSFKLAGKNYLTVVLEEDGFLPEGVISIFSYFLGEYKKSENIPGRPRYFNQIKVPEFWEISGNNSLGKVHNLNKERARIFYAHPKHKRLVKVVDWYDDRGVVRSSDHYNRQGALYARTIFNSKGQRVNKSYFDANGREIIMENYVTKDIILNEGNKVKIFRGKLEFAQYFFEKANLLQHRVFFNTLSTSFFVSQRLVENNKGDVLFWQEGARDDIPGNMQVILSGASPRVGKIMVQKKAAYEKLLQLGARADMLYSLGFIYPFKKENGAQKEALICTNSDRIANLQKLVESLPDMHFHIAALTEMSSKLMNMDSYSNVSLYPGEKSKILDELFDKCDYYFDINHESEIVSAVEKAFLHNHLIYAFRETLHNSSYVPAEHIYTMDQVDSMIAELKNVMGQEGLLKAKLEKQRAFALSESKESYSGI